MKMECIIQVDGGGVVNGDVYTFIGERKPRLACWALSVRPWVTLTQAFGKVPRHTGCVEKHRSHVHLDSCFAKTAIYMFYTSERFIYMRVGMGYTVDLHSAREVNHSWQACCNY
jgi:hypothetical protein